MQSRVLTLVRRRAVATLAGVLVVAACLLPAAMASAQANSEEFIRNLGRETIDMLRDGTLGREQREAGIAKIMDRGLDFDVIGRFVMGRYWAVASESQRDEFRPLFRDYIVKVYSALLGQYSGETFSVVDSRKETDTISMVNTLVERPTGPAIKVEWKIRGQEADQKITDVVVAGVSMAFTQRQQFESIIQNGGGKVDSLIAALKRRIGS